MGYSVPRVDRRALGPLALVAFYIYARDTRTHGTLAFII